MPRLLEVLAQAFALLGAVLLIGIALMTCASLLGRNLLGVSLVGDFELTAVFTGAVVALFLPLCQLQRNNIIVSFFTAPLSARANQALDRLGALLLAGVTALLAWRSSLGGISAYDTASGTMMLGFPIWIVYCAIVPGLALTAVIALWQALRGFDAAPTI